MFTIPKSKPSKVIINSSKSIQHIEQFITDLHYTQSIHIITNSINDTIINNLISNYFWFQCHIPLSFLINPEFIQSHIRYGKCFGLSNHSAMLTDDVVALLPNGSLILSVCKDTYETLGLTGKKSKLSKNHFVITINLMDMEFKSGSKLYDRVQWCFENTFTQLVQFQLYSIDPEQKSREIQFDSHIVYTKLTPEMNVNELDDIVIPDLQQFNFTSLDDGTSVLDLLEWVGMACINGQRIRLNDQPDPFVAIYDTLDHNISLQSLCHYSIKGFLTTDLITNLNLIQCNPLTVLSCRGFAHSPVSRQSKEHGAGVGGENDLVVIRKYDESGLIIQVIGANDELCL
ncbi:ribonuclease P 40kDa subunit-domain-containing protein [Globomyces pollinis-pini]|nr:ribonuclease P 40kDa subunit-domain-containing protein [Globomyces pollinis-pini]